MTKNDATSSAPTPDPEMARLHPLIGTWELKGRTLDSPAENIAGRMEVTSILGGFFLKMEGEMLFGRQAIRTLEILHYDAKSGRFPSWAYTEMGATPAAYEWDVQDEKVMHRGQGATYRGKFSADGHVLDGGWRPDDAQDDSQMKAYDLTMTRV